MVRAARTGAASVLMGAVLVVGAGAATADVLYSSGYVPVPAGDGSSPAGDGCWAHYPGGADYADGWFLETAYPTLASCQAWDAPDYDGVQFHGTSGTTTTTAPATTTTTTAPATTTTTAAPTTTTTTTAAGGAAGSSPQADPVARGVAVQYVQPGGTQLGATLGPVWAKAAVSGSPAAGSNGGWRLQLSPTNGQQYGFTSGGGPADGTTGPVCVRKPARGESYTADDYFAVNSAAMGTHPLSTDYLVPPYLWRPVEPVPDFLTADVCAQGDPERPGGAAVQTPAVHCGREWITVGGAPGVRITATVLNPGPAQDEVRVGVQWGQGYVPGTFLDVALPAGAQPADGWTGTCEVKRTLRPEQTGSTAWKAHASRVSYGGPVAEGEARTMDPPLKAGIPVGMALAEYLTLQQSWRALQMAHPQVLAEFVEASKAGRLVVPGAAGLGAGGTVAVAGGNTAAAALPASTAAAGGAATVFQATGVGAAMGAAAALGWSAGGLATGVASRLGVEGGDAWFCKWNPGYRLANGAECQEQLAQAERTFVRLLDGSGGVVQPSGDSAWRVGTATAQVRIDPSRPNIGGSTEAGLEAPALSPAETTAMGRYGGVRPEGGSSAALQPGSTALELDPPSDNPALNVPAAPDADNGCQKSVWGMLNPFNIAENIGCVLNRLFVPPEGEMQKQTGRLKGEAAATPFGVLAGVAAGLASGITGAGGAALDGGKCGPSIGWTESDGALASVPAFAVRLPSPPPCPGNGPNGARTVNDDRAADLLGYRGLARGLMSLGLIWVVVWSFLRSAPWASRSDEAAPDAGGSGSGGK